MEVEQGGATCKQQWAACSTFKVPLAAMAIEEGLIKSKDTSFKWDGKKRMLDTWNANQTAASWMSNSTVWVSQVLTPKIGMEKIKEYLKNFQYGNQDMSGGITEAWLSSTLKISSVEQLRFIENLWRKKLKLSSKTVDLTFSLMETPVADTGVNLSAKTGSSNPGLKGRHGWYVGILTRGDTRYAFATLLNQPAAKPGAPFAGREAKEKTLEAFEVLRLYRPTSSTETSRP
jgi:beta-lactamase class D